MDLSKDLKCPECNSNKFYAKYEATYVYSYFIDSDKPGRNNKNEFLPFLFDNRELKDSKEYVQCCNCGKQYPCNFSENHKGIDFTILQKAIRADHVAEPQFLG